MACLKQLLSSLLHISLLTFEASFSERVAKAKLKLMLLYWTDCLDCLRLELFHQTYLKAIQTVS